MQAAGTSHPHPQSGTIQDKKISQREGEKHTSEMGLFSIFRLKTVREVTIFKSPVLRMSMFHYRTPLLCTAPPGENRFYKGF